MTDCAQDADSTVGQDLGPELVVLALRWVIVNAPVNLEDEACGGAVEVDDEPGDDLLASKLQPKQGAVSQDRPRKRFGGRRCSAQASGKQELAGVDGGMADDARRSRRRVQEESSTRRRNGCARSSRCHEAPLELTPLSGAALHRTTQKEATGRARERDSRAPRGRVRSACHAPALPIDSVESGY